MATLLNCCNYSLVLQKDKFRFYSFIKKRKKQEFEEGTLWRRKLARKNLLSKKTSWSAIRFPVKRKLTSLLIFQQLLTRTSYDKSWGKFYFIWVLHEKIIYTYTKYEGRFSKWVITQLKRLFYSLEYDSEQFIKILIATT